MEEGAEKPHSYIAIDLKSFYASVECCERGLDPLTTNLVVADASRTEKTICLAVSPSLKATGIGGRPRLFEVIRHVQAVNARRAAINGRALKGSSYSSLELAANPQLALDYVVAPPHMRRYMEVSSSIYNIYLRYIAPEDIHVYSIDEVFIDVTPYLNLYDMDAYGIARMLINDVCAQTGITATAGIGTNLYLAKVAMDIVAKHMPADEAGVRIAQLDEMSYRRQLWTHRPLTDFWRVGAGYARRLESHGMHTMGDVARQSINDEELLYSLLGVNAEYLIDHAWGVEPTTIADIRAYKPQSSSVGTGQVLPCPYEHDKARLVTREMAEDLSYQLVEKNLVSSQVTLTIGYDRSGIDEDFAGPCALDHYGRLVPLHAHGSCTLLCPTASTRLMCEAALAIFDERVDPSLPVRRITLTACNVQDKDQAQQQQPAHQFSLFEDPEQTMQKQAALEKLLERESSMQEKVSEIRHKFGKNAILKASDLCEGARTCQRNNQVGGHQA